MTIPALTCRADLSVEIAVPGYGAVGERRESDGSRVVESVRLDDYDPRIWEHT